MDGLRGRYVARMVCTQPARKATDELELSNNSSGKQWLPICFTQKRVSALGFFSFISFIFILRKVQGRHGSGSEIHVALHILSDLHRKLQENEAMIPVAI